MVVLGILGLLMSFGVFIVALFTFLDKKDKKYPHPVCQQGEAAYVRTKPYSKASTMEWVLSLCLYYKLDVYLFQAILYMLDINKKSDRKCNHFFQSLIPIYVFLCLLIKMKKALKPFIYWASELSKLYRSRRIRTLIDGFGDRYPTIGRCS